MPHWHRFQNMETKEQNGLQLLCQRNNAMGGKDAKEGEITDL